MAKCRCDMEKARVAGDDDDDAQKKCDTGGCAWPPLSNSDPIRIGNPLFIGARLAQGGK